MAETVKHTPGPWEFDGDNAVMAEVGAHICTVSMADDFPCLADDKRADAEADCKAKANLIAAAPEMFEALKFAGPQLEVLHRHYSGTDAAAIYKVIGLISFAIAKAEGRS